MNDELHIPQTANDRKPEIGMKFASIDDAFEFYNQYAREAGFSARISNSKKNKMNEVVWKQFVCFKAGQIDEVRSKNRASSGGPIKKRARGEVRTDCKAKISIVKQQTGPYWSISLFTECHNHGLSTPLKVHLLRSHRSVSAAKRVLTQQFSEANIPTCQQMQLMEIEHGGPESVGCTERDIRNLERDMRDEQKGINAETLVEFFTSEKEKNSSFFFDYETDSDNRFKRCFWADHKSRSAYNVFGDVVVFDSTYNTNNDEKTESYLWLLNKFMEAMPTRAPKAIITDQDPAMTKALAQVLPKTHTTTRDDIMMYNVVSFQSSSSKPRQLMHDRQRDHISCSCGKFEFDGIPCRHMLAFFRISQIFELPKKYILKRWTQEAKIGVVYALDDENTNDDPTRLLMTRRSKLSYKASILIDYASLTDEGTKFLNKQLDSLHGKIKEMGASSTTVPSSQTRKNLDKPRNIGDPSNIRTKGCSKRMLSSKEKSTLKSRACHGCGLSGVSHDKLSSSKIILLKKIHKHKIHPTAHPSFLFIKLRNLTDGEKSFTKKSSSATTRSLSEFPTGLQSIVLIVLPLNSPTVKTKFMSQRSPKSADLRRSPTPGCARAPPN
ncbi:hypothetical protein SASPL_146158 [Salvia splendens]|uniref:SWIM-type domain-containing protein n=1 Tax=Salvia splendens TaxID=180675 RepID=A0A8X8WIB3_SALSN|nr:hypothetical protein SASPL_146158 [Salvia splendens]